MTHINNSQLRTWRHCEQQWDYRYGQHLIPRRKDRPMHIGLWLHAALETHFSQGDWRVGHNIYLTEYNGLFDEEREMLDGKENEPLPLRIERIIEAYLWQWRNDKWKVIQTEFDWRATYVTAKGVHIPFGGRGDKLVQDADGLYWIVDYKSVDQIPPESAFHAMDPQLILYPWGMQQQFPKMKIAGIIYDYLRRRPPSIPKLNQDGTLSKKPIVTDRPTAFKFLISEGKNPEDFSDWLNDLEATHELFARYKLPTNEEATRRILREAAATALRIQNHKMTTRNVTRDCGRCPYQQVCRAELFGLDTTFMRKKDFTIESDEEGSDGDRYDDQPADN